MNFNDYFTALFALFCMIFGGWNGTDTLNMGENPTKYNKSFYEYYFVLFFMFSNLCLINVVISFFVDNVMTAIGELPSIVDADGEEVAGAAGGEEEQALNPKGGAEIEMGLFGGGRVDGDMRLPQVELEVEVEVPEVEVEVEVPEVEVEVEVEVPEVEVEVEIEVPEVEVEVEVEVPEVEVEVEVEVPEVEVEVEVEVAPDAIGEPVDAELEAGLEVDAELEVDVDVNLG
jgi:hypothetical protein